MRQHTHPDTGTPPEHASPRQSLLTRGCQSEITRCYQPRDSLVSEQMEGALSPSDAGTDLISSHFPFPPGIDAGKCILICILPALPVDS